MQSAVARQLEIELPNCHAQVVDLQLISYFNGGRQVMASVSFCVGFLK